MKKKLTKQKNKQKDKGTGFSPSNFAKSRNYAPNLFDFKF